MTRTRFLVAMAVAALSVQLFPRHADSIQWIAVAVGAVYLGSVAWTLYLRHYGDRRRVEAQRRSDEEEYRRYRADLEALRLKYAVGDAGPADDVAGDYASALASLHARHRDMLERKFGFA